MSTLLPANRWGLTFHHLGLAAKDPQVAAHYLLGFGYQIGPLIFDPLQNVRLRMCTHDQMPNVEIISPAGSEGPLDKLMAAHEEGLVYHICYTTANLEHSLDALKSDENLRLYAVSPPKEAILFGRQARVLLFGFGCGSDRNHRRGVVSRE